MLIVKSLHLLRVTNLMHRKFKVGTRGTVSLRVNRKKSPKGLFNVKPESPSEHSRGGTLKLNKKYKSQRDERAFCFSTPVFKLKAKG